MEATKGENKKKILVVDDEVHQLEVAEMKLKKLGYDVMTAANGKDGLKIAEKEDVDLILLDVMMPGLDGCGTAELLLKSPKTSGIPIIFLTCIISEQEEIVRSGKVGGRQFLAKPVDAERLREAIKGVLGG